MSKVASSSSGLLARTLMRSASTLTVGSTASTVSTPFRFGPSLTMAVRPRLADGRLAALTAAPWRRAYSDKPTTSDTTEESRTNHSSLADVRPGAEKKKAATSTAPAVSSRSLMEGLADLLPGTAKRAGNSGPLAGSAASSIGSLGSLGSLGGLGGVGGVGGLDDIKRMKREVDRSTEEYKFTVYSTKHNTHVTVTKPNGDVIVSMSCGNLGFRNSQARSYDAAYQVGAYVCDRLYQRGWHNQIQRLEVVLRGFGQGREAVTKVLLGNEGRLLRSKIVRVADNTRLKFGGTRSKKTRRLG